MSEPGAEEIQLLVLAAVGPRGSQTTTVAQRLGQPAEIIHAALSGLVQAGLVEMTGASVTLTQAGRLAVASVRKSLPATTAAGDPVTPIDLNEIARFIGSLWPADAERAAAEETARAGLFASDADRDTVVQMLSEAFSQGRLSPTEFELRSGRALTARTYGDLDAVLQGLDGLQRRAKSHPVRKAVFWMVALLSSPFVMLGAMFFAFGEDAVDHIVGVVFLILLLPGLFALRRWAWPRA